MFLYQLLNSIVDKIQTFFIICYHMFLVCHQHGFEYGPVVINSFLLSYKQVELMGEKLA